MRLYNLFLSKDKTLAHRVRQMTGFVPARLSIFKLAFSHKSNQGARDYAQTNNERLEYLGDAVLGTIVAEYLFKKYPNADEGFLTKMRSKIVKRKSLNAIGDAMGLDVLLTEYNRTRLSASMLGNAVEALVGAVYLEKGYHPTKRFIIQRMLNLYVDMHELETVDDNYKSQLLEHCQKNGKQIAYKLVKKFKQDRRDRFKVAVLVGGEELASADDFNKKAAEQTASLLALRKLGIDVSESAGESAKPVKKAFKRSEKAKTKSVRNKQDNVQASVARATPIAEAVTTLEQTPQVKPAKIEKSRAPKKVTAKKPIANAPPKKVRRNNTLLGRAIWQSIVMASAVTSLFDEAIDMATAAPKARITETPDLPILPAATKAIDSKTPPKRTRHSREIGQCIKVACASIGLFDEPKPKQNTSPKQSKSKLDKQQPSTEAVVKRTKSAAVKQGPIAPHAMRTIVANASAVIDIHSPSRIGKRISSKQKAQHQWENQALELGLEEEQNPSMDWENTMLEVGNWDTDVEGDESTT